MACGILVLFLIGSIAGNAFAKTNNNGGGVVTMFVTDQSGSETPRQPKKFSLGETPWLFVNLDTYNSIAGDWYRSNSSDSYDFDSSNIDTTYFNTPYWNGNKFWLSLKDTLNVSGEWHIHDILIDGERKPGYSDNYQIYSVVTTPEPVSSALFLLGGTALAAVHFRRKKKA